MKRTLTFSFLFLFSIIFSSSVPFNESPLKIKKVVIDAGHGGKDPGTSGKNSKEKDVALGMALELGAIIKKNLPEVEVIYTRKTDVFVELEERANIANEAQADLFISIHCNAAENTRAFGTETYVMGMHKSDDNLSVAMRENASILMEDNHQKYNFDPYSIISYIKVANHQSAHQIESLKFATKVEKQFGERVKRTSRGVRQSGFLVLWQTSMPSVLIEIGFLSNLKEESYLLSKKGKTMVASGIFRAFKEYKNEAEQH